MKSKISILAIPLLVIFARSADATPQFSQSNSMQLTSFNDLSHPYDAAAHDWLSTMRYGACPHSWWDSTTLSLAFVPMSWAVQDFNYSDAGYWNAALTRSDCTTEDNSPLFSYMPESFRFSSLEPLTLISADVTNQTDSNSPDSSLDTNEVQPERTPISGSRAARELTRAWKDAMRRAPSADVVLILTAHWAHETHGGRSMFNYNFGGIKGHSPVGMSCIREAHEGSGYHVRALKDRFRAYPNAKEGAQDYLSLLIRKYPQAIEAAERGDVTDFVSALKRGGYFTGSEADYSRDLSQLAVIAFEQGSDALAKTGL
jgi:hypothetical protein